MYKLNQKESEIKNMKKQNKKLAQQRKAEAKRKQARKNVLDKLIKIGVPSLLLVALIVVCLVNPFAKDDSDSGSTDASTGTSTESTSDSTDTVTYDTDTSLTVKDGDTVNIDYVGSIDGVEFSGGNTNGAGADLTIGSGTYIDDFEEQLIGSHPGDTVEVNVTFPENYGNEELNGKDALFVVEVNGIY